MLIRQYYISLFNGLKGIQERRVIIHFDAYKYINKFAIKGVRFVPMEIPIKFRKKLLPKRTFTLSRKLFSTQRRIQIYLYLVVEETKRQKLVSKLIYLLCNRYVTLNSININSIKLSDVYKAVQVSLSKENFKRLKRFLISCVI